MQVAIEEDEVETDMGAGGKPDPITVAVVESRLNTIALEMAEVMIRTSMSQILNSSRDFSTAIIDADCQLVAQGEGIPVHISALPLAAAAVKQYFGDKIYDGDMFALNDPLFWGKPHSRHHCHPTDLLRRQTPVLRCKPRPSQRCRRGDPRRVQPLGERDIPGRYTHTTPEADREGSCQRRRAADAFGERASPGEFPRGLSGAVLGR